MNELIKINYDSEQPTVSGRELHEFLEVKSKYADWFKNMSAYGFDENTDFTTFSKNLESGGRTIDHQLTVPMAKELCMIQHNEKGKQARQYMVWHLFRYGIRNFLGKRMERARRKDAL